MSAPKYCNDPDHCTYSDCPTAFCDRNAEHSFAPATLLGITDLTHKAINALRDAAPDGRAAWVTGHLTPNADGTVTVAFRHKIGGKTATFKVNTETEAKLCCKIMRQETRGS